MRTIAKLMRSIPLMRSISPRPARPIDSATPTDAQHQL